MNIDVEMINGVSRLDLNLQENSMLTLAVESFKLYNIRLSSNVFCYASSTKSQKDKTGNFEKLSLLH